MYKNHVVGVVVPAYNEEGLIGDVIRDLPEYVDYIYLIDDASTDGTWEEARSAAREEPGTLGETRTAPHSTIADGGSRPTLEGATVHERVGRVVPIQHRQNRGAGASIKTGYVAARTDGIDITVTVDGDGQMDPHRMSTLLDPIVDDEADYAKGNRLLSREYRQGMPRFRLFGNSILTFLTKIASGYWKTSDPQNGYTAISKRALDAIEVESIFEYYGYCNDILVKLNAENMRVADVPMPAVYGDEESSIDYPSYMFHVSRMLLRNFMWRLKTRYLVLDFHPLALFYLVGSVAAVLSIGGGLWTLYNSAVFGASLFVPGVLSLVVFLIGSMFLLFAMVFDMQANEHREVRIHD